MGGRCTSDILPWKGRGTTREASGGGVSPFEIHSQPPTPLRRASRATSPRRGGWGTRPRLLRYSSEPTGGHMKQGYVDDIQQATLDNETFRTVLYTGEHLQLVVMTLKP